MPNPLAAGSHPGPVHPCAHLAAIRPVEPHTTHCRQCIGRGHTWTELRLCLSCGWVSCAGDSPNHHARDHYEETDHAIATTLPPDPANRWCYAHRRPV